MIVEKRKYFRKVAALLLCMVLGFTCIPADSYAKEVQTGIFGIGNGSSGEDIFHSLTDPGKPEGYNENEQKHPYGYGDKASVLLKNSRLNMAASTSRTPDPSKAFWLLKGYKKDGIPVSGNSNPGFNERYISNNGDRMDFYAFVQAESFDPDGDGLRDKVAYIGVNKQSEQTENGKVNLWTLDTNRTDYVTFEDNESMVGAVKFPSLGIPDTKARNFLSITSGDYNGDGKDTIVVFACLQDDQYGIFEYEYNKTGSAAGTLHQIGMSQVLLNPAYNETTELHSKDQYNTGRWLQCHLSTGDVNNDGIDDLIVTSGIGRPSEAANIDQKIRETYLGISLGQDGMTDSVVTKSDLATYMTDNNVTVTSATSDVGNISGDSRNKLTVSGYRMIKDSAGIYQHVNDKRSTTVSTFFYEVKNGELVKYRDRFDEDTNESLVNSPETTDVLNPVPVVSACVDGYGQQEQLFINGYIYKLMSDGSIQRMSGFMDTKARILYDAQAASLTENNYGIEQFCISYLGITGSSYGQYTAKAAIISGNASFDANGSLTPCTGYTSGIGSAFDTVGLYTNMLMVPYENQQTDVMRIRLNEKGYYYSNPEPVAVLQAAPYFKEVGSAGSTQYSITVSYTQGSGTTTSSAIGGGFAESLSIGSVFRQSFNVTYKTTMSYDFKQSEKKSFTTTFTATSKDTVVVQCTPVIYYSYDVYNPQTGQWGENEFGITNAQIPLYTQITVEQYNDFADYYNEYIEEHKVTYIYDGEEKVVKAREINPINATSYFLGNVGNPGDYANEWTRIPGGQRASKGAMALGYQGGTTTNNFGYETSETETHTTGWTVDHSLNVQIGGQLTKLIGAWVGGSFNKTKGSSDSTFTTTGNGFSIAGTVKNLDMDALTRNGQFSEDSVKAYSFQWTFGLGEFTPHNENNVTELGNIPVCCYVVENVKKGIQAPVLDSLTITEDQKLHLAWSAPSFDSEQAVTGYHVYLGDIDGNYERVTETALPFGTFSYDYTPEENRTYYSFIVTAIGTVGSDLTKVIESMPSNAKSTIYIPGRETIVIGINDQNLTYGDALHLSEEDLIFPEGVDKTKIDTENLRWVTSYKAGSSVGTYTIKPDGIISSDYAIFCKEGMITVEEKELKASDLIATAENKEFDGKTDTVGTISVVSGLYENDRIGVEYRTAEFDTPSVGFGKRVTFTGLSLSGEKADNYCLYADKITTFASVVKATALVWADAGTEHRYDGKSKKITVGTLPECETEVHYYSINDAGIVGERVNAPTAVGSYMYLISIPSDSVYEIQNGLPADEAAFVGKAYESLHASNIGIMRIVKNAQTPISFPKSIVKKTYGDEAFVQQVNGSVAGATIRYEVMEGTDAVTVDPETGEVTILKPGTALIKATAEAEGYEDATAQYVIVIDKKLVQITMGEDAELIYTGQALDMPYEVTGDVPGNELTREDIRFTYTSTTNRREHNPVNVGEYDVKARIPVTNEYYLTDGEATGILTITASEVLIIPDEGQGKKYGQYDPAFTYQVEGLLEGETLEGTLGRESGSKAGDYAYTLGTLSCPNHTLAIADDAPVFTIAPAPVYDVPNCKIVLKSGSLKVSWSKISGADGYMIYASYCPGSYGKVVKTVSAKTSTVTIKKLKGKKIDPNKNLKCYVAAYQLKNGKKTVYKKSLSLHRPSAKSKYTTAKAISIKSAKTVTLNVGKTAKIKAATTRSNKKKSLLPAKHLATYRYTSTAKYIATVDKTGKITAKGSGICYIKVYAQNGVSAKVKVVVK